MSIPRKSRALKDAPMSLSDLRPAGSKWEDLEDGYQEALSLFSPIQEYINATRTMSAHATPEERERMTHILKIITIDCERFKTELDKIRERHLLLGKPKVGPVNMNNIIENSDAFEFLDIAGQYYSIGERIQAIFLQPASDLSIIFDEITKRVEGEKK